MILLRQKEFVKISASKKVGEILGNKKSITGSLSSLKTGYGKSQPVPLRKTKELGTKIHENRPKVYWTREPLPGSKKII